MSDSFSWLRPSLWLTPDDHSAAPRYDPDGHIDWDLAILLLPVGEGHLGSPATPAHQPCRILPHILDPRRHFTPLFECQAILGIPPHGPPLRLHHLHQGVGE